MHDTNASLCFSAFGEIVWVYLTSGPKNVELDPFPLGFGNIFVFLLQIWENNNFEILMIFWLLKENMSVEKLADQKVPIRKYSRFENFAIEKIAGENIAAKK